MELRNTTMDDIAAVVGYTAARRLHVWFEGENLYVPIDMTDECVLARLLGLDVASRLSAEWPGEHIPIPLNLRQRDPEYWKSRIWRYARDGMDMRDIAEQLAIGERRVQQIVRELEQLGMIAPLRPRKTA